MNIQDAYIKGLNDAENAFIEKMTNAIDGIDSGGLPNPELEKLRQRFLNSSKTKNTTTNTYIEDLDKYLKSVIMGDDRPDFKMTENTYKSLLIFEKLMVKFREVSQFKNNVGKSFEKTLNESIKTFTEE